MLSDFQIVFNNTKNYIASLPSNISLLAVTKTKSIEQIEASIQAGQSLFGENYVQEAVEKIQILSLKYPNIEWHLIGHLQSNKAKLAVQFFSSIDSVDSIKLAYKLQQEAEKINKQINILIQVKISKSDTNKHGISPDKVDELALIIEQANNLTLKGLQIIENPFESKEDQFVQAKHIFDSLQIKYKSVTTLSMGMSGSVNQAIQSGSNMIRIGTAMFGVR